MKYPQSLVGWLFDVLNSLDWKLSPLDILGTEERYPGLIDDLSTESWQRKIIHDQIKPPSHGSMEIEGL
jgi:hypothetical protein